MLQKIIIVKIIFGMFLFLAILLTGCENSIIPRVETKNEILSNSAGSQIILDLDVKSEQTQNKTKF